MFRGAFWTHARTNAAVTSPFGEVVRHSGLCEFHSGALCREVSHGNTRGATRGARETQCPGLRITGDCRKVPIMSQVFSSIQYIYSQKALGSNMGRHCQTCFLPRAPAHFGTLLCRTVDSSKKFYLSRLHLG